MTRTTLKALWFGGGGILATWFAVSPNSAVSPVSPPHAVQASSPLKAFEELSAEATRLRDRHAAKTPNDATRNPFRFNTPKPVATPASRRDVEAAPRTEAPMPVTPLPPPL